MKQVCVILSLLLVASTSPIFEDPVIIDEGSGSGDYADFGKINSPVEGSGGGVSGENIIENDPKACHFDCTTPQPLPQSNSSFRADIKKVLSTFVQDVKDIINPQEATTTTTTTTSTTTENYPIINPDASPSEPPVTIVDTKDLAAGDDVEESSKQTAKTTNSTFIFLSVLIVIIMCLIIYAVVKKRIKKNKRSAHEDDDENVEEKIPIHKTIPPLQTGAKIVKRSNDDLPYVNGKEFVDKPSNDLNGTHPNHKSDTEFCDNDVELRSHSENSRLLTPETRRVTVKACELTDSLPKTPLLVTRHMNSDGSIETRPSYE